MRDDPFAPLVHPGATPTSRRRLLHWLSSAGVVAAGAPVAPMLARAETASGPPSIAMAWSAAWNSHQSARVAALFTADGMYEDQAFGLTAHGTDAIATFADGFFQAAPDLHINLIAGFGTDDWAAAEWILSGTDTGGMAGMSTGKRFTVRGATIFQVQDGQVRRDTDYYNARTVLQQLGRLPVASSSPTA
jgi:steroid delta-isomerase-like uncharacterized protein